MAQGTGQRVGVEVGGVERRGQLGEGAGEVRAKVPGVLWEGAAEGTQQAGGLGIAGGTWWGGGTGVAFRLGLSAPLSGLAAGALVKGATSLPYSTQFSHCPPTRDLPTLTWLPPISTSPPVSHSYSAPRKPFSRPVPLSSFPPPLPHLASSDF